MIKKLVSTIKTLNLAENYGYICHESQDINEPDYSFKLDELTQVSVSDLSIGAKVSFLPREWINSQGLVKRSASDIQLANMHSVKNKDRFRASSKNNVKNKKHDNEVTYLLPEGGINDSELIIGLVSAVGTETSSIIEKLKSRLISFDYSLEEIRVSELIECNEVFGSKEEYKRIKTYMRLGDEYRQHSDNNAILAAGTVKEIKKRRHTRIQNLKSDTTKKNKKVAYIINSLKHPDEVELLRKVYGEGFYLIGIHADEERRLRHLVKNKQCEEELAKELISIDENEEFKHGQKTRDTFHLADFFLNLGKNNDQVENTLQRFLELIFSHPHKNPTFDEYAMFMAFNSSVRSGDLSRQVGAVLSRNKQILATGANDVPKAGGGLYWAYQNISGEVVDDDDGKDYMREKDPNKEVQTQIVDQIIKDIKDIKKIILNDEQEKELIEVLKSSRIGDLTEFGRVVHAEMEAILSCSREGISTSNAVLYCTTFPCHNCAKHIIASGIERVVYVEPYPKSMALQLHGDAIELKELDSKADTTSHQGDNSLNKKVVFESFIGVGPRRFLDLFSMTLGMGSKLKRKNKVTGKALNWSAESSQIRTPLLTKSYLEIEDDVISIWTNRNESN